MHYGCFMSNITLKDVPSDLHIALKSRAAAQGRSLNREILVMLDTALHAQPLDAAEIGARARSVRETMGVYLTRKDLNDWKCAGRR